MKLELAGDYLSSLIMGAIFLHVVYTTLKAIFVGRIALRPFRYCNEEYQPQLFWALVLTNVVFSLFFLYMAFLVAPK